jgi:hypothetical protein
VDLKESDQIVTRERQKDSRVVETVVIDEKKNIVGCELGYLSFLVELGLVATSEP